jgi:hypothetical protein
MFQFRPDQTINRAYPKRNVDATSIAAPVGSNADDASAHAARTCRCDGCTDTPRRHPASRGRRSQQFTSTIVYAVFDELKISRCWFVLRSETKSTSSIFASARSIVVRVVDGLNERLVRKNQLRDFS